MKENLKKIYQDLASGKLSRNDALEGIRSLKLRGQNGAVNALLGAPVWEPGAIAVTSPEEQSTYTQRCIVLCELPNVNAERIEGSISKSRCVSLQTMVQKNIAERFTEIAQGSFDLIKKILTRRPSGKILVQIVIPNNHEGALFAGLSGLLKTAALENPQMSGQIILIPPNISGEELIILLETEAARHPERIIKYENGSRIVLRLKEVSTSGEASKIIFKDQGVYLITGGLGGLGMLFAEEIIKQTKKAKIILVGRSELTLDGRRKFNALFAKRKSLEYRQVDIAAFDQVKQLIAEIESENKQLNGIIHCAGVNIDNFILKKTSEEFRRVLSPKVTGTFNLDQASCDIDLDFMVLFSSVASWLGNAGQADYATANSFLDQFAVYRNSLVEAGERKGKTLSINWPLWREGGMRMNQAAQEMLEKITGLHALETSGGILNFYRSLELLHGQIMVMNGDYAQIRRGLFEQRIDFQEALPVVKTPAREIDATDLFEKTQEFIRKQLATQLKISSHRLEAQAPLEHYGIDSILSLNLTTQLEKTFGSLPKTLFFEYQTIHELTGYFITSYPDILTALFTKGDNGHSSLPPVVAAPKSKPQVQTGQISGDRFIRQQHETVLSTDDFNRNKLNDPIAIIGLSGRYPESKDIQGYWQNLRDGKDCIIEVPKERWDWREYFTEDRTKSGHHYSKWGGFISGVDEFDPRFFNISPKEAETMDPQERLFLQHAWMAVEDAGYTRTGLEISDDQDLPGQVGVYVGVMYGEYQLFGAQDRRGAVINSYASIANRVSYVLNLHGPSMTLDTMCSSSLTAIHIACQDLRLGRTSLAIAGGVNVSIHPKKYLFLSAGQFISSDGHCQSFGEGGDGYIPGEGVGVVVLKRLSEAVRDGDHIYGIIKGSALNHGGKTNGYSVPNPPAQAAAISRALSESNTDARHISYIEAHGTGTKLGDPIEIAALSQTFKKHTQDNGFCFIGSAKSNIGHCESAAGIAGLSKVLLQMQHQQIVPSLHSKKLNPHIDFQKTPFVVNQTLKAWDRPVVDGQPVARIAGVSSFGAGGSNAHIILQEYVPSAETKSVALVDQDSVVIVVLSARTEEQLKQKAVDLLDFIQASQLDLVAMAYTLQVGREAMEERLGFIVSSIDQLADKLQGYIKGELNIEDTYQGQVKRNREALSLFSTDSDLQQTIDKWVVQKKLSKLLDLWVKGLELDWNKLYNDNKPNRISLPTYPFAKERYWLDTADREQLGSNSPASSVLHPLLHLNTSDLTQQSYTATFSGTEFFFADYQGNTECAGQKILLPAAYLEMARVAVEKALPTGSESSIMELRHVVWGEPFVITETQQLTIALFTKDGIQVDFEICSKRTDEDIVHCQGQAGFIPKPTQTKLEIEQIKRAKVQGTNQLLSTEILPTVTYENSHSDYILHPTLMENALQASHRLISNRLSILFAIQSVRIVSPCTTEMFASIRNTQESQSEDTTTTLDIDLCDKQGNVCVQMRGVAYQEEVVKAIAHVSPQAIPPSTTQGPKEIPLAPQTTAPGNISIGESLPKTFSEVQLKKPSGILVVAPGDLMLKQGQPTSVGKASVVLSNTTSDIPERVREASAVPLVTLSDYGKGIYSIKIAATGNNTLSQDLIEQLLQALNRVQQESLVKVLILSGAASSFLRGGRKEYNDAIGLKLYHSITAFPYPIIAAMQGDATGAGFLVGILCDFMICSTDANYSCTALEEGINPTRKEYQLFEARFGKVHAKELMYLSATTTGRQLKERGLTCPIVPPEQVDDYAHKLASGLANKRAESLSLLKRHLSRHITGCANALTTLDPLATEDQPAESNHRITYPAGQIRLEVDEQNVLIVLREKIKTLATSFAHEEETSKLLSAPAVPVPLESKVVTATVHAEGIVVVKMEDREARNMFSDSLTEGIAEVFEHIAQTPEYKVVVLTGYGNYFASGGTKETLLSIQQGKTKFTDNKIYQIAMNCRIPVIAAMQGHAVGAGWAMGMFADFVLLSEESKYFSPYMNYGFTPGAGATFIFPEKIGHDLARETLLTAREYSGSELKERGISIPVLPREKVYATSMALARQIANYSRSNLIAFKHQLINDLHKQVEEAYRLELAMHEKTFVGQSDTLRQIDDMFYQGSSDLHEPSPLADVASHMAINFHDTDVLSAVTVPIRKLLAQELHMQEHEIDEHTQFIDLGLDSVTGVTWVRKINEKFKISMEATKIYTYPTLAQLSRFVREEAEKAGTLANRSEATKSAVPDSRIRQNGKAVMPHSSHNSDTLSEVTVSIKRLLAGELHLQEHEVDENTQFIDLGLDSITGVTWIRKINERYKTSIEATKIYSHPTLVQLSRFVKDEACKLGALPDTLALNYRTTASKDFIDSTALTAETRKISYSPVKRLTSWRNRSALKQTRASYSDNRSQPIAVIGMAGQFPMAGNLEEFWKNIAAGKNCISAVPKERWDINTNYHQGDPIPGKTNSKWAGLLAGYDLFDPLFFNISPTEAVSMDPQQRVLLQACWHSIENAGYNPKMLSGSKCGVYIGCASGDYHLLSRELQISAQGFTGGATSILAARISYLLNLQGPCLSIDTACSSSLVAIATACDSLISGNCDLALAGGVYVMVGPDMHIKSAQSGMLSRDGKCHTFDSGANGFVPGEGVGVVMLKRLSDAEKDNDIIYGVIQGWGVNQDGKTNGITAPNEEAQIRLEQALYDKFQIDPNGIQLIEAHGTGTKLGDPIEVNALKQSFKKYTNKKEYCALGSVKSNIGHCLTSAGVASFIKTLLALKHKQLPPTINYNQLNEHIELKDSPFFVNDRLRDWRVAAEEQRKAAISAFGFSGTNAHIVVAEYVNPVEPKRSVSVISQNAKIIVPLSARTADQLKQKASDLLDFIRTKQEAIDLVQMAYTLQVGREAMGERLAFMVTSQEDFLQKLQAYVKGESDIQDLYHGQVKSSKEGLSIINRDDDLKRTIIETCIHQGKLSKLIDLWVKGIDLDWNRLYRDVKPQRISLPGYPFAKERYWFNEIESVGENSSVVSSTTQSDTETTDVSWDKMSYLCRWEAQTDLRREPSKSHKNVLVVCSGSSYQFETTIQEFYRQNGNSQVVLIRMADKTEQLSELEWTCDIFSKNSLERCLQGAGAIDALYFVAMNERKSDVLTYQELVHNQEANEIQLLRILKTLKHSDNIGKSVDTYILTLDNYSVNELASRCFGAGVTGLGYSIAQGKYQFQVRNLDLCSDDLRNQENQRDTFETIYNAPFSNRGEVFKIKSGRRYRQAFLKLKWDTENAPVIRQNGVYLIVGGSGTVGRILTRKLIQSYNAQVIWIGRSAANSEKVHTTLRSCKEFSDNVSYFEADVTDQQSMEKAIQVIKRQFAQIHGAVFAGMVFDFENSIDDTTEDEFRSILEVKTRGSWIFNHVLEKEPLDFMCYFSSGQAYSFSGASKLSAYSTAITFADRLVQSFSKRSAFPVGIINWGFWKSSVSLIAEDAEGVSTDNLDALEDSEGFGCFEKFVNELKVGRINQVLCMKVSKQMESLINIHEDEYVALAKDSLASPSLDIEIPREKIHELKRAHEQNQLENWLAKLLFCQFNHLVQSSGQALPKTISDLQKQCRITDKYVKWFNEGLNMLAANNFIRLKDDLILDWKVVDGKAILNEWELQKVKYCQDNEFKSLVILLDDCLQKLPEILLGYQLATDVIFPNSSMEKVESIYKNNATSDTFNEIVANSVVAYLQEKLKSDPQARLRILEIGAGTGGTSTIVFKKLRPFQKSIEKYCYTDLSKAFFFHAEKHYVPENPYIHCQRLDIEKPIEDQDIEIGSYDLVIATNVLHATKNIRQTLRNAKAAMYKNGYIILNEMSDKSLTTHLTFGLLDGWWLFEDSDVRIPNCPGLYSSTWHQVLQEEGFTSVEFPVEDAHILGQQIVLAQSDGVIRQQRSINAKQKADVPAQVLKPEMTQKQSVTKKPLATVKPAQNLKAYVKDTILAAMASTLRIPLENIDAEIAFSDYGIDSILGVNFVNQVNGRLAISLNTAIIFEYSSLDRLSEHVFSVYRDQIEKQLNSQQVSSSKGDEKLSLDEDQETATGRALSGNRGLSILPDVSAGTRGDAGAESKIVEIAVVGISGMMPKASNADEFWNNIIKGVDGVGELPENYLDSDAYYSSEKQSGKTRCKWGGIVNERDCFDPLFFNLSPWEAESMNPHQRLVLQEGWKAIENAGYSPKRLSGSRTGVFIGTEPTGYYGETFTGYSDAIIASRLSYILNLKGPAISINTGCSSSGVALHLACESLRNRETDLAVAGGVNACMDHNVQVRLDEIDMLSPKGRCNTFDAGGSGTIISEGIGIVILKRLEDAIASDDFIYGVICGSGINQDGASNGITAPNGAAQEELIVDVYNKYGINPENITYVEAHGTGTKLGDPIEANALVRAFKKFTTKRSYCSVGSAKSHVGHTGAAAAVTGLIKVLQSLKHKQIPRLLHFSTLNPLIEFADSPFYISTQPEEWKTVGGAPRMAALNSFGHSGTNVHLVIKEYISQRKNTQIESPYRNETVMIPLSAKTDEQLRQKAAELLAFIGTSENGAMTPSGPIDLAAMAYTLQLGRDAMEERLGLVVDSIVQLAEKLESYINGEQGIEGLYKGQAKRKNEALSLFSADSDLQETIEKWIADKRYPRLLELWVKGMELDWNIFYTENRPGRICLPSYPFAKERYWYTPVKSDGHAKLKLKTDNKIELNNNINSIEDIINRIDNDSIEHGQALSLLKGLI